MKYEDDGKGGHMVIQVVCMRFRKPLHDITLEYVSFVIFIFHKRLDGWRSSVRLIFCLLCLVSFQLHLVLSTRHY